MNRLIVVFFLIFIAKSLNAQIHEIGVFAGGANYIGDVGPTTYIAPNEPAVGILYKWNRSPRHSWRFSLTHAKLESHDADSEVPARKERNLGFDNELTEFSAGMEFDFFDFNLHDSKIKITPYVYSGLSYALYRGLYFVGDELRDDGQKGTLAIPMTLGIKARILPHLILGIESGARFSFADDLDGSNPSNENLGAIAFGNINSNDWYVFTGLTLTYTFGNKPCYCAE